MGSIPGERKHFSLAPGTGKGSFPFFQQKGEGKLPLLRAVPQGTLAHSDPLLSWLGFASRQKNPNLHFESGFIALSCVNSICVVVWKVKHKDLAQFTPSKACLWTE